MQIIQVEQWLSLKVRSPDNVPFQYAQNGFWQSGQIVGNSN
jgi:hypothetical protein